jgi:hypothetical protein
MSQPRDDRQDDLFRWSLEAGRSAGRGAGRAAARRDHARQCHGQGPATAPIAGSATAHHASTLEPMSNPPRVRFNGEHSRFAQRTSHLRPPLIWINVVPKLISLKLSKIDHTSTEA